MMSAGSHTEPGGYTRRGAEHCTEPCADDHAALSFQDGKTSWLPVNLRLATIDHRENSNHFAEKGFDPVGRIGADALSLMRISLNGRERRKWRANRGRTRRPLNCHLRRS